MEETVTSKDRYPKVRNENSLGIVSIATNKYIDYWTSLAKSIEKNHRGSEAIELILLTDQAQWAQEWTEGNINLPVHIVEIPSYGWPEATLFRYKLIYTHRKFLKHRTLVYMDADSLINLEFSNQDFQQGNEDNMTFVEHPGFWRPDNRTSFYIHNPLIFLRDLYRVVKNGGNGAWETKSISQAFVPRALRKKYYCGGVWFGPNEEFQRLCFELSKRIEQDLNLNYIAKWHDESHLNWWATRNVINTLSPEYCYAVEYKHLKGLKNRITAVKKT